MGTFDLFFVFLKTTFLSCLKITILTGKLLFSFISYFFFVVRVLSNINIWEYSFTALINLFWKIHLLFISSRNLKDFYEIYIQQMELTEYVQT